MIESLHLTDYVRLLGEQAISRTLLQVSKFLQVERKGDQYIPQIQEHLHNGTVIVPFNHPSLVDPMIVIHLLREHFDLETQRFVFLTAQKFIDGRMGAHAPPLIRYMENKYGIKFVTLIQHNDTLYNPDEKRRHNRSQLKMLRDLCIHEPQGLLIAMAPEGTRSVAMNKAQSGFDFLVRSAGEKGMIAPIALQGTNRIHAKGDKTRINLFAQATVEFLQPQLVPDLMQEVENYHCSGFEDMPIVDAVMYRIAQTVPFEHRGAYATYPPMVKGSPFILQTEALSSDLILGSDNL